MDLYTGDGHAFGGEYRELASDVASSAGWGCVENGFQAAFGPARLMAVRLSEELAEFVEGGLSMLVGTRDTALRSQVDRAVGAFVCPDRESVTVYLNKALSAKAVANLHDNGRVALTLSRPYDHRSLQMKGQLIHLRDGTEEDRVKQERWLAGFVEHLYIVGLPRSVIRQVKIFPSVALTMRIDDVFVQTPGPGAGRRLPVGSSA